MLALPLERVDNQIVFMFAEEYHQSIPKASGIHRTLSLRVLATIMLGMKTSILLATAILVSLGVAADSKPAFLAQQISVDGVPVIRLTDSKRGIEVSILPSIGNIAYEMKVHGQNILFFPDVKLSDFQKRPMQTAIPFLAPWANRMDDTGFWANGKKYNFDEAMGNFRKDNHGLPIHGLLSGLTKWDVTRVVADKASAFVTSRFEFWKHPDLMAQWPFAHEYEMTYKLADGALEVRTTVVNLSTESMPVAIGFHPYYRIPDIPRDNWILRMPARTAVIADDRRIPTGEFKPVELPNPLPLKNRTLDDGFTDLERDKKGLALFSIESEGKQIELLFGPKFPVAVVWEPAAMQFICIEPMAGVTNAINLHHAGKYPALQTIAAGGKWTESFWIRPKGF
jgi:aldose 1-epimerase